MNKSSLGSSMIFRSVKEFYDQTFENTALNFCETIGNPTCSESSIHKTQAWPPSNPNNEIFLIDKQMPTGTFWLRL